MMARAAGPGRGRRPVRSQDREDVRRRQRGGGLGSTKYKVRSGELPFSGGPWAVYRYSAFKHSPSERSPQPPEGTRARPSGPRAATTRNRTARRPRRQRDCLAEHVEAVARLARGFPPCAKRTTHKAASRTPPMAWPAIPASAWPTAVYWQAPPCTARRFQATRRSSRWPLRWENVVRPTWRLRRPRLIASNPSDPVPAKRSMACLPATAGPSRLNTASRTRSFIGRVRGSTT